MTAVSLEGKTILVTGAAGFIGSNLAERLLGTIPAVQVIGLDNVNDYYDVHLKYARLSELEQYERFEFIKADLSDKKAIDALFSRYQPEIVVNLAAQAGVRRTKRRARYEDSRDSYRLVQCASTGIRVHAESASAKAVRADDFFQYPVSCGKGRT